MSKHLSAYFIIALLFAPVLKASVEIQSYRKSYSWKSEWSVALKEELEKPDYKNNFLNLELDQADLAELGCHEYNNATLENKTDFWIVFFAALTRAESGFNEKAASPKTRGHRSYGLLQLAKQTAKNECGINPPDSSVLNASDNLKCGIKLMQWQIQGAPRNGRKLRSDLEGHIFGKNIFQWGPLRQNDKRGRRLLVGWFKDHLDQLKFCKNES